MTDSTEGAGAPQPVDEVQPPKTTEERVTALEARVETLVAELHRHMSLRLPEPAPAAPAAEE